MSSYDYTKGCIKGFSEALSAVPSESKKKARPVGGGLHNHHTKGVRKMTVHYEVLSPWADIDPIPVKGISSRLDDMTGKTIGFFLNSKIAAEPMSKIIEENLKERYQSINFSRFVRIPNISMEETPEKEEYVEWLKGLDAVIYTHGD